MCIVRAINVLVASDPPVRLCQCEDVSAGGSPGCEIHPGQQRPAVGLYLDPFGEFWACEPCGREAILLERL